MVAILVKGGKGAGPFVTMLLRVNILAGCCLAQLVEVEFGGYALRSGAGDTNLDHF